MSVGARVRGLLGPRLERFAANSYRRMFVDLDDVAATVAGLGRFHSVIEVGCGEGSMMSALIARLDPDATALGIDIADGPGRNYIGRSTNVQFRQADVAEIVAEGGRFDLVLISDVLHHVPPPARPAFLRSCGQLAAGGTIVLKEWVKRPNLAHAAAFSSDRYITGDKGVSFYTGDELKALFTQVLHEEIDDGDDSPGVIERTARPHRRNNVMLAARLRLPTDPSHHVAEDVDDDVGAAVGIEGVEPPAVANP